MSRKANCKVPSLVLATVAAGYVWLSYDYDAASRTLPWIAGVLAVALASIDIASKRDSAPAARLRRLSEANGDGAPDVEETFAARHAPAQEAIAFAWIGAFLPLVVVLGFYSSILLYVFCYLRLYARKGAAASAATAVGVLVFLYVVFDVLMGYEIFGGLLAGDYL